MRVVIDSDSHFMSADGFKGRMGTMAEVVARARETGGPQRSQSAQLLRFWVELMERE